MEKELNYSANFQGLDYSLDHHHHHHHHQDEMIMKPRIGETSDDRNNNHGMIDYMINNNPQPPPQIQQQVSSSSSGFCTSNSFDKLSFADVMQFAEFGPKLSLNQTNNRVNVPEEETGIIDPVYFLKFPVLNDKLDEDDEHSLMLPQPGGCNENESFKDNDEIRVSDNNSVQQQLRFLEDDVQNNKSVANNGPEAKNKRKRPRAIKTTEEVESQRMTHIAVERNRRKQMNEHLRVLRSLMPGSYVQRGDQASIIGGAIEFVRELEQLLQCLESQKRRRILGEAAAAPGGGRQMGDSSMAINQQPQTPLFPPPLPFPNDQIKLMDFETGLREETAENKSCLADVEVKLLGFAKRKHEREHMMRSHSLRHLTATTTTISSPSWLPKFRSSSGSALASLSFAQNPQENQQQQQKQQTQQKIYRDSSNDDKKSDSNRASSYFPKRGQELELVCESLAYKGKGVCRVADTGFVVLCDRVLPGEKFIGRVTRKKGSYAEVTKLKTLSPHWDSVDAPCEYASYCGGCKTQNLSYEAQLRAKEGQVRDLVVHVGKFSDKDPEFAAIMKPIVPCDIQFHYRNKMEFSFGPKRWFPKESLPKRGDHIENYSLGLHAPGFFDKVLNIDKCLLQSEPANLVLAAVQVYWRDPQLGLSPYDVHSHSGFLKHLMLRTGSDVKTGLPELMVNFVTSSYKPELLKPLIEKISSVPEVVSIMNNVNTSVGNTSVGEEEYTLYGKSNITETLRGLTFQISANSFFQTNTHQAEVLYKLIEDCAGLRGDGSEIVLDLFCGTGTIGLTLARWVKHVYGYEVVPQAISDACRNAKLNNISNATFVQGDLNKIGEDFGNAFPKPDIVISDPNRPGMHMKLIKFLLKLKAPHIVYVSCNPATCARDLDYLCHGVGDQNIKGCYKLKSLQPVDMFPHTPHIECVCLLELS